MRNAFFIVALTLALFSGIAAAGERDRRQGGRPPRELRDFRPRRDARGPLGRDGRWGFDCGHRRVGPGFGPMAGHPGFSPRLMDELDLSAEQTDKIIDVLTESFRDGLKLRIEMIQAGKKARDLRRDENASAAAIIAINRDIGELRGKMEALHVERGGKIESILSPGQVEKMKEFRRGPGRGHGRDGHGPRPRRGDDRWDDGPGASLDDDADDE